MKAYRALRHGPRALEALYPLAGIVPPVSPSGGRAGTATDTGRSRVGGSTVKLSTNGLDERVQNKRPFVLRRR